MEGTRVQLQQDIMDWLDGDYDSDRLWMHGAAGSGKSAVAQSIAETCAKKRSLAAAFFFNFRHTETDNHARFIPTIAYQLAQSIPSTRAFIGEVVSKDVLILKKGFKVQLEALLLKPLAQARELNPDEQWPHVIIIDGLDECKEKVEQAAILTALHERTKSPTFPFRIIIVSRPEIQMRKYFSGIGNSRTFTIDLNGEEYNVEPDLDIFLRVSFDSIRRENHIEGEWPGENAIVELKSRATGQFVYADTVVKYVGDDTRQPKEHLKEVMDLRANPGEKHPLSPLYALYDNILRRCADPKGSALAIRSVNERVTVRELAAEFNALFYFTPDSWARIFDNLHSLLFIPEYTDAKSKYKIRHKSLIDFLKSKESTKDMYFSEKTVNTGMAVKFLQLFERKCLEFGAVVRLADNCIGYSSESSRQNASNVVKYMLPLQNIFFSWALSKSDLKDSRLVQLLGSIDVASCVLPDGDNKFHQNDLNRLWSAVHHKDLGVSEANSNLIRKCLLCFHLVLLPGTSVLHFDVGLSVESGAQG